MTPYLVVLGSMMSSTYPLTAAGNGFPNFSTYSLSCFSEPLPESKSKIVKFFDPVQIKLSNVGMILKGDWKVVLIPKFTYYLKTVKHFAMRPF